MASTVFRRSCLRFSDFTSRFRSTSHCLSSRASGFPSSETNKEAKPFEYGVNSKNNNEQFTSFDGECWPRCPIETVDDDAWNVSSSLSQTWREYQSNTEKNSSSTLQGGKTIDNDDDPDRDPDHDEIDNMRIRGDLFYKIDRGSKEFEEYSYDFHRKNHHKITKKDQNHEETMKKKNKETTKSKECNKRDEPNHETVSSFNGEMGKESEESTKKRDRTPTFNQLTAPYHYPFCLDIYISKASVRACVIHRVTSKVVSVAHSISKDMKFDLGSTRNAAACTAVGTVLAQRTLEDDIHDIIYTPRKGDKVEGKLQIVLQAIIDNGVNVKVKLKQRKLKKKTCHLTTQEEGR